jgi:zinc transport system substrate-binding protein
VLRRRNGLLPVSVLAAFIASVMLIGCSKQPAGNDRVRAMREGETALTVPKGDERSLQDVTVVAGLGVLADLVKRVRMQEANTSSLAAPGVEPHDLELSPKQVQQVIDADLVVYLGNGFQPSLEAALKRRKRLSVDLLKSVDPLTIEGVIDPHFWLDPLRYAKAAGAVGAALSVIDPSSKANLQGAAIDIAVSATTLDQQYRDGLKGCARRELVTAHTAFGYIANRYGLVQVGVAGVAPDAEPSPQRMRELSALIKAKGVTTVFSEELVSSRVADALAREANVKVVVLSPLESFSEQEVAAGATYFPKMLIGLVKLQAALGCR